MELEPLESFLSLGEIAERTHGVKEERERMCVCVCVCVTCFLEEEQMKRREQRYDMKVSEEVIGDRKSVV